MTIQLTPELQATCPKYLVDFAKDKLKSKRRLVRVIDIYETQSQVFIKYILDGLQTKVYFKEVTV